MDAARGGDYYSCGKASGEGEEAPCCTSPPGRESESGPQAPWRAPGTPFNQRQHRFCAPAQVESCAASAADVAEEEEASSKASGRQRWSEESGCETAQQHCAPPQSGTSSTAAPGEGADGFVGGRKDEAAIFDGR